MNQHTYVENCQRFYFENGLEPGNPDDGNWQEAHYPLPRDKGDDVVLLLFEHHQVQGLLQSEEMGGRCFFPGDTKKFFTSGPFVDNWFELWDLYEKWQSTFSTENNLKRALEKDELGRSVFAVHASAHVHDEKNEEGKSVCAVKAAAASHKEKDEDGKSVNGVKNGKRLHEEKLLDGRSKVAVEAGGAALTAKFQCLHTGRVSTASGIARRQRKLGYESGPAFRVKVTT